MKVINDLKLNSRLDRHIPVMEGFRSHGQDVLCSVLGAHVLR